MEFANELDGYDITLSRNSYSAQLIAKILEDARKKGGVQQRTNIPWQVIIRFPSSLSGAAFWNSLPPGDVADE